MGGFDAGVAGDGTFATHTLLGASEGITGFVAVDLDSDGDMDLLANGGTRWYQNTDGVLMKILLDTSGMTPSDIKVGDLDGDGDVDFASTAGWHENDGSENFTIRSIYDQALNPRRVLVVDLDNDEDLDVLTYIGSEGDGLAVTWYKNDGAQEPEFSSHVLRSGWEGDDEYLSAADMNGDALLDVVYIASNTGGPDIYWLENSTSGAPFTRHATGWEASIGGIGDINGDESNDILGYYYNGSVISFFENDGQATPSFSRTTLPGVCEDCSNVRGSKLIDLNSDGHLDVITSGRYGGISGYALAWFKNNGNQSNWDFTRHILGGTGSGMSQIKTVDWDGDGDLDILLPRQGALIYFENLGLID